MKTNLICFLILSVAFGFTSLLQAEPILVGNKAFTGQTLDADGIKAVLLGKKITLGDTRAVIIIAKTSDVQEAFLKAHVGMTAGQFQTYWRRLFMTGGGTAPKIVANEMEALKLTAEIPGAITVSDSANAGDLVLLGK